MWRKARVWACFPSGALSGREELAGRSIASQAHKQLCKSGEKEKTEVRGGVAAVEGQGEGTSGWRRQRRRGCSGGTGERGYQDGWWC